MVRSAAAVLAVLILSGSSLAQEPAGTHTVVRDDTLWDLAQRYYQDPFQWRVIWEANRAAIDDPNLIFPDQVLTIPGAAAEARAAVGQERPGAEEPALAPPPSRAGTPEAPEPEAQPERGAEWPLMPGEIRTIFYRDRVSEDEIVAMERREYVPVDIDEVRSAPWLLPPEVAPRSMGRLEGFALETDRGSTMRPFHQVRISTTEPVRVGDELRTFRIERSIRSVGRIAVPTGVLSVLSVDGAGAVAVVSKEYGRIQPGDLVGPTPEYGIREGVYAQDVQGGPAAMIMGFAGTAAVHDVGHHAFLDLGASDGIGVGDEFVLFSEAVSDQVRGVLQVVGVTEETATARIQSITDDVFARGVVVRLTRQMP